MTEKSKSVSCVNVRWTTRAPLIGEWHRTPYFHLRQDELCLEVALNCKQDTSGVIEARIVWRRPPKSVKLLYTRCYLTVGRKMYHEERNFNRFLWNVCAILSKEVEICVGTPVEEVEEWTVVCQLSCVLPFDCRVERETIHLSTVDDTILSSRSVDRYVQATSEIPRDVEALSHDYSRLLREQVLSDFQLKCEGRIFPVHRTVLAARSEVFRAMFLNEMQETQTGSAEIKDVRAPVLDLLLTYVYSGKLEVTLDTVADLFEAADKYAVRSLMNASAYYMIRNVTAENCLGYLTTAFLHSDPDLKAGVVSFVLKNPDVFKSAAWMSFSAQHPILANEVLQNYASSINP